MLRIKLFGGVTVDRDGIVLASAIAQRRPTALLALLATAPPRGVSRERLLARLWPDSDDEKGRRVLAQTLYSLKRDLEAPDLVVGTSELRLNTDVATSDVAEFESAVRAGALERAVSLYQGPFLDGFHLSGAAEFERWVEEARSRFAGAFRRALEQLARAARDASDPRGESRWLRLLASQDPTSAEVTLALMRALEAAGDRSAALQHARVYGTLVRQDLELEPDARVLALAEALRAAPSPRPTHVATLPLPTSTPPERTPAPWSPEEVDADEGRNARRDEAFATPFAASPARPVRAARRRRLLVGVVVSLVAVVLAVVAVQSVPVRGWGFARAPQLDSNRVVVIPLENRTGDHTLDAVGSMAADWVTQGLANTGVVDLVDAGTAVLAGRLVATDWRDGDGALRVRHLAAESGARFVLWGAYYRDGDTLRMQARLTDAERGVVVRVLDPATAPAESPTDALESLRLNAMAVVAQTLDPRIASLSSGARRPPSFEAYREYVEGVELQSRRRDREAAARFHRAAQLDTTFSLALLHSVVAGASSGGGPPVDSAVRVLSARRTDLAPVDRAWLDLLAAVRLRGDFEEMRRLTSELARLAPASFWPYLAAVQQIYIGHPREALARLDAIDPERGWMRGSTEYWVMRAQALHMLGEHERELAELRAARERYPSVLALYSAEARALAALGREPELRAVLDAAARAEQPASTLGLATVLAVAASELDAHGRPGVLPDLPSRVVAWSRARPAALDTVASPGPTDGVARAAALYQVRAWAELRAAAADALAARGEDPTRLGYLGAALTALGDTAGAAAVERRLTSENWFARNLGGLESNGLANLAVARMAALRGDDARALTLLSAGFKWSMPRTVEYHADPAFARLRARPEFRSLTEPWR